MLPRPSYGNRFNLWKTMIEGAGGQISKWADRFDISALTKVSDSYTGGHIAHAVRVTLTERRIMQQGLRPLKPAEFVPALAACEPVYKEEEELYATWYSKTAMGKRPPT